MPRRLARLAAVLLLLLPVARISAAQEPAPADSAVLGPPVLSPTAGPDMEGTQAVAVRPPSTKATPLVAPVPFYNSQLGAGIVGVAGVLKPLGPDAPPSSFGLFGMVTTNGSWGVGLGSRAHLAGDAWRAVLGTGYFDMRFDYYGTGGQSDSSVPLRLTMVPVRVEALRRVVHKLYLGGRVQYAHVSVGVDADSLAPPFAPYDLDPRVSDEVLLAPLLEFDGRDSEFYPTSGVLVNAAASFLDAELGSDSTMQRFDLLATWQHGWAEGRDVLAAGLQACYATGEVPINHLCIVGAREGLRGYEPGRYLDRTQVTLQAEYRRRLGGKFGVTAFAGAAQVATSPGELSTHDLLAAVGVGVRFRLVEAFPINYRADVAYGRDGVQLYFSIGEAF